MLLMEYSWYVVVDNFYQELEKNTLAFWGLWLRKVYKVLSGDQEV